MSPHARSPVRGAVCLAAERSSGSSVHRGGDGGSQVTATPSNTESIPDTNTGRPEAVPSEAAVLDGANVVRVIEYSGPVAVHVVKVIKYGGLVAVHIVQIIEYSGPQAVSVVKVIEYHKIIICLELAAL